MDSSWPSLVNVTPPASRALRSDDASAARPPAASVAAQRPPAQVRAQPVLHRDPADLRIAPRAGQRAPRAADHLHRLRPVPLGTSTSATTMKIIATISGTPSATVKNAAGCPGWAACSTCRTARRRRNRQPGDQRPQRPDRQPDQPARYPRQAGHQHHAGDQHDHREHDGHAASVPARAAWRPHTERRTARPDRAVAPASAVALSTTSRPRPPRAGPGRGTGAGRAGPSRPGGGSGRQRARPRRRRPEPRTAGPRDSPRADARTARPAPCTGLRSSASGERTRSLDIDARKAAARC